MQHACIRAINPFKNNYLFVKWTYAKPGQKFLIIGVCARDYVTKGEEATPGIEKPFRSAVSRQALAAMRYKKDHGVKPLTPTGTKTQTFAEAQRRARRSGGAQSGGINNDLWPHCAGHGGQRETEKKERSRGHGGFFFRGGGVYRRLERRRSALNEAKRRKNLHTT